MLSSKSFKRKLSFLLLSILALSGFYAVGASAAGLKKENSIMVESRGGFISPQYSESRLFEIYLHNDSIYTPGIEMAVYPGPAVPSIFISKVSSKSSEALAKKMYNLLTPPKNGWGNPPVADVPSTHIKVFYNGKIREANIYALGFGEVATYSGVVASGTTMRKSSVVKVSSLVKNPTNEKGIETNGLSKEQVSRRKSISNEVASLHLLVKSSKVFQPTIIEGHIGGVMVPVKDPSSIDDNFTKIINLPLKLPISNCFTLKSSELPKDSNQASLYKFLDSDDSYQILFRPLIPGEIGCSRG